jgi:signal transduction histidine kinase
MTLAVEAPDVSRHKCLIYDGDPSEQLPVIVPLLLDGLRRNERCLYLGSPAMVGMIEAALASSGVDVAREVERGALILSSDRPPADGQFDPAAMVGMLESMVDDAVRDGFAGLCATGDMRWELGGDANFERLTEYEALLEQVFPRKPLRGICQYHRGTVPEAALQTALMAHQSLYVQHDAAHENLFYVPPELLLEREHGDKLGAWMCQQLTRIMAAERSRDRALTELENSNRRLEETVRQRTAALEAANKELEAFSYSASHDLRAPVRHIDGFAQLLESEFGSRLGKDGLDYLAKMRAASKRMAALIDGLMALGRAGRQELHREHVDLTLLAEGIASDLRRADPERTVAFAIQRGLAARGDVTLVRSVLENLLGNAWKFTAGRKDARIALEAVELVNGFTAFRVADNGAGFDMARAEKLFEPFARLHSQQEFHGSGIGLATAARIVQRHGGRMWAESKPGGGASFYFSLPSVTPPAAG